MSAITSNLAEFVMKPTFVIIIALAVHFGLRRASAATRHLTLSLALVGLLVLPFFSMSLPAWELEILPTGSTVAAKSGAPSRPVADLGPSAGLAAPVRQQAATLPASAGGSEITTGGTTAGGVWTTLVAVWLLGSLVLLAKVGAGLLRMRWIVRQGQTLHDPGLCELLDDCRAALHLRVRPQLVASERIGVPLVWGWLRPALIVPREFLGWTLERKRAVLLHELAHLKRSDWPVLLLGRIVASLYWFHPLIWYVERCAKRECERACDDLVVRCGTKPSDYAAHLLSIARGCPQTPEGAMAALAVVRRSHLNSRVRSILDPLLRRGAPSRRTATVLSVALVLVLLPFASVQLAERAHANEPPNQEQESDKSVFDGDHEVFLAQHSEMKERELHEHDGDSDSEGARQFKHGYSLHGEGRYDEAIEAFEQAIALDYRPSTAMYNIGCCHALLGEADSAMSWLEQARDAGMDDPEMLTNDSDFDPIRPDAGFQRFINESFEAAGIERRADEHYPYRATLERFEKLQNSGSTDGKAWYKVGTRLIGFGELDRSAEALSLAVEHLGEWNSTAMYNLACAYSLDGKTRQALGWLDQAVAAGFDQHELFLNDADLNPLRDEKEFQRISETSELLSLESFPRREWDKSNYSADRWAPAVKRYEELVEDHPSSGRGWFNLGYALHHSSRFDEALAAFGEARELNFRLSTTTYNLACGNAMLGRTDTALQLLGEAVDFGGIGRGQLEHDSDLDSLRSDSRFEGLLERLEEEEIHHKLKHKMKHEEKVQARHLHEES
jgi:beta-lactamase regulating signal transducer with metallopeptidase domain/Flp pilus assembly protein TadD